MERTALLAALKTVEPALASRDLIPALTNIAFLPKGVVAFDDVLAIKCPTQCGFQGTFPGRVLIDFLTAATSKAVEVLEQSEAEVVLKVGRSKLTLPTGGALPTFGSDAEPATKDALSVPITDEFLAALARASISIGFDSLQLWSYGVTIVLGKKKTSFLATNNFSIARAWCAPAGGQTSQAILPPRFVDALLKQSKRDKPKSLHLWEAGDWVAATFTSGTVMYGRSVPEADPSKFQALLEELRSVGDATPIPQAFGGSLSRAGAFLKEPAITDRVATFRTDADKLYIEVLTDRGTMRDVHKLPGHATASLKTPPELLAAALPFAAGIAFLDGKAVRMDGDGFEYVVAATA